MRGFCFYHLKYFYYLSFMKAKKCTKCGEVKPLYEFYNHKSHSDGKTSRCVSCIKSAHSDREYMDRRNKMRTDARLSKLVEVKKSNVWRDMQVEFAKKGLKKCSKCEEVKSIDEFSNRKANSDGKRGQCKECQKKTMSNWRLKNIDYEKTYRKNNASIIRARKAKYDAENKDKNRAYQKWKSENDVIYNLSRIYRRRVTYAFQHFGYTKRSESRKLLGCSWEVLKQHMESQFTNGMTWGNRGDWHIDHIIPLASANTEEELMKLNHYKNLQPLWAKDNRSKGDSMPTLCVQYKIRKAINW